MEKSNIKLDIRNVATPVAELFNLDVEKNSPLAKMKVPVKEFYLPNSTKIFNHPLVDPVEEDQIFDPVEVADVIPYLVARRGQIPCFYGSQGTGKTSTVKQYLARMGIPRMHGILGDDSDVRDLSHILIPNEDGTLKKELGQLAIAMKNGYTYHIDEYDLLPKRQQKLLNEVFENYVLSIDASGSNRIVAHNDFRVMITANTNNTGSQSGWVSGAGFDGSINERFQFIHKDYLAEQKEIRLLKGFARKLYEVKVNRIDANKLAEMIKAMDKTIEFMVTEIATRIRGCHQNANAVANGTNLVCTMSTRILKFWVEKVIVYQDFFQGSMDVDPIVLAFERSFCNGIHPSERDTVLKILNEKLPALKL